MPDSGNQKIPEKLLDNAESWRMVVYVQTVTNRGNIMRRVIELIVQTGKARGLQFEEIHHSPSRQFVLFRFTNGILIELSYVNARGLYYNGLAMVRLESRNKI